LRAREFWICLEFHRKNCKYFGGKRKPEIKTNTNKIKYLDFFCARRRSSTNSNSDPNREPQSPQNEPQSWAPIKKEFVKKKNQCQIRQVGF
jgi:hypothetical protein